MTRFCGPGSHVNNRHDNTQLVNIESWSLYWSVTENLLTLKYKHYMELNILMSEEDVLDMIWIPRILLTLLR